MLLVVFILLVWVFFFILFVFIWFVIMFENEFLMGEFFFEGSEDVYSSDGEDYYVFNGDFVLY